MSDKLFIPPDTSKLAVSLKVSLCTRRLIIVTSVLLCSRV